MAAFIKKNTVMLIALAAALVTTVWVPVDGEYLGYFDWKTLTCLFCVLAVVCALKNVNFFYILARWVVERFSTVRVCVLVLVYITFIGSMLIANDMALLTFLPLGFFVLTATDKRQYMAVTFILQNIAANLGGMLTPFGNPQNLYLYSHFSIPTGEFMRIMAPHFLLAVGLITVCCLFLPGEKMRLKSSPVRLNGRRTAIYLLLFVLAIAIVFRGIPYWVGLIVIPPVLFFMDKKSLAQVDYPLLLTFFFFFVFSGNMARIPAVQSFFSGLLEKNTLLVSILSCQCISNVPSAILLSRFTENYPALLVGVNLGGTGTLIASLASLITFREYVKHNPGKTWRYLGLFTAFNAGFLAVMTAFACLVM